jgi:hypothetical protein
VLRKSVSFPSFAKSRGARLRGKTVIPQRHRSGIPQLLVMDSSKGGYYLSFSGQDNQMQGSEQQQEQLMKQRHFHSEHFLSISRSSHSFSFEKTGVPSKDIRSKQARGIVRSWSYSRPNGIKSNIKWCKSYGICCFGWLLKVVRRECRMEIRV